jgi:S1-C subfamily serine protease
VNRWGCRGSATRARGWRAALLGAVAVLLAACAGIAPAPEFTRGPAVADLPIRAQEQAALPRPTPVAEAIIAEADAEYLLLTNLYERVTPSVVNIEALVPVRGTTFVDTARGSGFVYDETGHIITNAHVVQGADQIQVTFADGFVAPARIVGVDTYSDLAVLRVNVAAERLLPLVLADSDAVRVGQRAIAIGNPFGLSSSMSAGIVSGKGRTLRSAELIDQSAVPGFQNPAIIQTDTPINPGNSGGPLLNSLGEVIGVNTAIRSESGVFAGVGFAVPANTVARVVPELIAKGRVDYGWLGITVLPESAGFSVTALAEPLGLPVTAGVLIRDIHIGSPADRAGLQGGDHFETVRGQAVCDGGDIIVAVDGRYVNNMDELVQYLVVNTGPGDTIDLLIVRGAETFSVPLTLEARPASASETRGCG